MLIFKSTNKLKKVVNFKETVGFVPTMGALHKGHISLIKKCKKKCKKTIVSIFVNPTQFNNKKDFCSYPKSLSKDMRILKKLNVDYLFLPNISEIYKAGNKRKIKISNKDKIMCAKFRPGHFEGVLAVINQFLLNIKAKYIFFGEKDFQQLYLINKFIEKKFATRIISCKTIRDKSNLPYSSRIARLSYSEIVIARKVSKIFKKIFISLKRKFKNNKKILFYLDKIRLVSSEIEYFDIRNKNNLTLKCNRNNFKIFIAYKINHIRLIDNI
tara:strand:- start:4469 stop:5278 length:810 start_codon:yes stop_codon:yes gene_type:complete